MFRQRGRQRERELGEMKVWEGGGLIGIKGV